jgi:phosphoribosylaminoimidazolecarboxamide formyltransferase/IMP cyclohydrolase
VTLRALIGVSDKTGLVEFASELRRCGVEIVATGGTQQALRESGIEARPIPDLTGFPEMLDGRVKTLHPAIHAAILARRDDASHMRQLQEHGFVPIDIVVVTLYPFADTVARGADEVSVVEQIDIGGPTLIRAAAKNADFVTVVVSPAQYAAVLDELREHAGVSDALRARLAAEAFAHVAAYDTAVADWLRGRTDGGQLPAELTLGGGRLQALRYGENPHQQGALYALPGPAGGLAHARQLQGPALSFTNWLDVDSARRLVSDFEAPAAGVIKHTNPCGFAVAGDLASAYRAAYACDPRAAYGGVVGLNRPLDAATAHELTGTFLEAVVCPAVADAAMQQLSAKGRLRVLAVDRPSCSAQLDVRSVDGGLLVQTQDRTTFDRAAMQVPTRRSPETGEWEDLLVAWRVCHHVKSNAVVIVAGGMAVGVGAGQMSRVEAAELAVGRAGQRAVGAVAASDAFFPMPDGLEVLGRAGVRAVIHPGGSKRDPDVIAAADALGIAVVHTGERHFRH